MSANSNNFSHIKLISFDLDDTLWDNKPVIQHAVSQSLQKLRQYYSGAPFEPQQILAAKAHVQKTQPELAWNLTALRQASYAHILLEVGLTTTEAQAAAAEATAIFSQLRNRVTPFTDVEGALQTLAKHWPIAAISNGNCNLFNLAIGKYFSFYISPLQAKCVKPNPQIYQYAAHHIGLEPSQILHIGDCPTNDVDAAKYAGCQTVWCNRKKGVFTGNTQSDYEIADLDGLVDLLELK